MKFEDFYQVFMVVFCQLPRADQNSLLMTRIYPLLSLVHIPEGDQSHVSTASSIKSLIVLWPPRLDEPARLEDARPY